MTRRNEAYETERRISDLLRRQIAEMRRDPGDLPVTGCGDTSCLVTQDRGGMRTNGGCRCGESELRRALTYWRRVATFRAELIRELREECAAMATEE